MKRILNIIGILLLLIGIVWAFQGANILPGSFMTGQIIWLKIGIVVVVVGIGLLVVANRRRENAPPGADTDGNSKPARDKKNKI